MSDNLIKNFRTKILNIKRILSEIKKIGVDITQIEKTINSLEEETEQKASEVYKKYEELETDAFLTDYLNNIYNLSIKKVDMIYEELLQEYNTYYQIYNKYNLLNEKLISNTYDNIDKYINIIKTLLKLFQDTPIANSNMEKKLVEIIYPLIYRVIQLELNDKEYSNLLEYIKRSEINSSYLETYIQQEINALNLNDIKNKEINQRITELHTEGLNFSYLDSKLIKLLFSNQTSIDNKLSKESTSSLELIPQYYEMLLELLDEKKVLDQKEQEISVEVEEKIKKRNNYLKRIIIGNGFFITYVGAAVAMFYALKLENTTKKYHTITEKYNITTNTNLPTTTTYEEELEIPISIIKYNPWKETSRWEEVTLKDNEFIRKVQIYDVSNIIYEDLSDYANISPLELGINPIEEIEGKDSLIPDDLYNETFSIVQKITQDKDDIKNDFDKDDFIENMILTIFPLLHLYLIVSDILNIDSILMTLKSHKKSRKLKKEIKELKGKLIDYKEQLKTTLDQIEKLNNLLDNEYKRLPNSLKETEEVKDILKKIKLR